MDNHIWLCLLEDWQQGFYIGDVSIIVLYPRTTVLGGSNVEDGCVAGIGVQHEIDNVVAEETTAANYEDVPENRLSITTNNSSHFVSFEGSGGIGRG